MFKRLLDAIARAVDERRKNLPEATLRQSTAMERMFGDCAPAVVAFKIDNGYVVRSVNMSSLHELGGAAVTGFTYCRDHQAIADHIVSEAAREKVMPKQQPLSFGSPHANQVAVSKVAKPPIHRS